jgi:putative transcriptional regulator
MVKMNLIGDILSEQGRSQAWLSKVMGKDRNTVNNWCQNKTQPNLRVLFAISDVLNVDIFDLIAKPPINE